jgi:ABC-type glutathione transport system ATPase component
MNQGEIVEIGPTESVIGSPQQDYTKGLIANTPSIEASRSGTPLKTAER